MQYVTFGPRRWGALLVCLLLVTAPGLAYGNAGEVLAASGEVSLQAPGAAAVPAAVGAAIGPGTVVRTGKDGNVELQLGEGRLLKLSSNSRIRLSARQRKPAKRSVMLFFGRLWNRITTTGSQPRHFDVVTHNATAGVRGTDFESWAGNDGSVKHRVNSGDVEVSTDGGNAAVSGSEETTIGSGSGGGGPPNVTGHSDDDWDSWSASHDDALREGGAALSADIVADARENRDALEDLTDSHERLTEERDELLSSGEPDAERLQQLNDQIDDLEDDIANLADQVDAQAGLVNHMGDLASDPAFGMADGDAIRANAAELERLQSETDNMAGDALADSDVGAGVEAPSAEEPGGFDTLSRSGGSLLSRVREVVHKIDELHSRAVSERDQVRAGCIAAVKANAQSLKGIAEAANSDLESGAARRDSQAVDDAYSRLSIAAQKCEQLLAEAEACAGELDTYTGETDVDVEVDEESEGEEPELPDTGSVEIPPEVPPVASPYQ